MAKKHAPIQQLREASKETERILRDRNIHTKESAIDAIVSQGKVPLPGMPAYLPHRPTIAVARRVMADILILWLEATKDNKAMREDHKPFFSFVIKQVGEFELKEKFKVDNMPEILRALKGTVLLNNVFKPMQTMETAHTMKEFLYHSFAIAHILKQHDAVSDYIIWFDEWTKAMDQLWIAKDKGDGR